MKLPEGSLSRGGRAEFVAAGPAETTGTGTSAPRRASQALTDDDFDDLDVCSKTAPLAPLTSGVPSTVEFMLEPVAYTLLPGHQLRISLAGADKDNFLLENIEGLARSWRVHTGGKSSLFLPVEPAVV